MPRRKDDDKNTETIRIRLSDDLKRRCNEARLAGPHSRMAESSFVGYLIEVGLQRYERHILPLEQAEDEPPETPGNAP